MKKNFVLAAVAATGLGFAGIQAHAQQSGSSVVPEGSCAIQVASRPNLVEVADFIGKLDSRFTSVKVYKATSGWYAITIGNVEVNMGQQYVNEYVSQGLIPADSVCVSDGKKYVTEVDWRNASSFTTDGTTSIIPDGSCAIIAASRQNLSEVKDFIGNLDSSLTNIQVFQSTNGWYAVSVGLAPIQQGRRSVENLVQQGLIPSDSLCSSGKMYVAEVDLGNATSAQQTALEPPTIIPEFDIGHGEVGFASIEGRKTDFFEITSGDIVSLTGKRATLFGYVYNFSTDDNLDRFRINILVYEGSEYLPETNIMQFSEPAVSVLFLQPRETFKPSDEQVSQRLALLRELRDNKRSQLYRFSGVLEMFNNGQLYLNLDGLPESVAPRAVTED